MSRGPTRRVRRLQESGAVTADVLRAADHEADLLGHPYIGLEHLELEPHLQHQPGGVDDQPHGTVTVDLRGKHPSGSGARRPSRRVVASVAHLMPVGSDVHELRRTRRAGSARFAGCCWCGCPSG